MGDGPLPYLVIIVLILFSAFFSMTETAYSCCNRIRLKVMADDGKKSAKLACKIADKFDKALITILVGNNIVNIFVTTVSTLIFMKYIADDGVASVVSTVVVTIIVYLCGETIPKSIAKERSEGVALFSAYIIRFFMIIFTPITIIFQGFNWVLKKIFKKKEEPMLTEDDFTNIIETIEQEGIIEEEESDIIQSAIDFGETVVKDVLTPRNRIYAIDIDDLDHEKLNSLLLKENYSRIPVYKKDIDHIIGILHVKSYLKEYLKNRKVSIRSTLQKPYIVSNSTSMDELFEGFRHHKTHIAIVVDKNGKTLGMVTMEDVLEELVGEINETDISRKKGGAK